MKNYNKLNCSVLLFFVAFLFFGCASKNKESEINWADKNDQPKYVLNNSLSLNDYASAKGYFPEEGLVATPEMAVQIAEIILSNIYGKKQIEKETPFFVNLENDIWLIEGYIDPSPLVDGGVAYIEIRKSNGEILKVTHQR